METQEGKAFLRLPLKETLTGGTQQGREFGILQEPLVLVTAMTL